MADEKHTFSINPGCKSWIDSDPASVNSPRSYGVVLEFFVVFVILVKQSWRGRLSVRDADTGKTLKTSPLLFYS